MKINKDHPLYAKLGLTRQFSIQISQNMQEYIMWGADREKISTRELARKAIQEYLDKHHPPII